MIVNIALDGPSGAGKSTLAKMIAEKLGYVYVDTGALYRSIGLYAKRKGIDKNDCENVIRLLNEIKLDLKYADGKQRVFVNGEDVSDYIRTSEISMYASAVSAIPDVRAFLLDTQRSIAKNNSVIMDGRDIGTVILPNADVKIFLTASAESRAMRRYKEFIEKDPTVKYDDVYRDIVTRDKNDSTRAVAPAIKADDAIILDNSDINLEQTLEEALKIINEKVNK